jgi:DNA-binding IclR family transcriptional regulator
MSRAALSATRAVAVLNFLAAHPAESFTLSDLSTRLGINLSSAHSLLAVLTDAGYVVRHPRQRTYTLGPSLVALGSAALERHAVIDHARDAARELARAVGLEVAVSAPAGSEIVFLARAGDHQARGMPVHVGQRVPLVPPLGAVFVAWGDAEGWLDQAEDADDLRATLAGVRRRGYSVALEHDARKGLGAALDQRADMPADDRLQRSVGDRVADLGRREYQIHELDPSRSYEVSMIAAPVFDATGDVVLALTVLGFPAALAAAEVVAHGERVRDAGLIVTKASGGRAPQP